MADIAISLRSKSVSETIEKITQLKEAHPDDVLRVDVTILDDYYSNS